ncbi:[acyl-carrier-protein] S-malonyltransferase [Allocatelliglobosispora scoriae]|uniref:[acyl-carrier-protein] S-malonyltransferase n=1 Tax=Allocatelliglobosispora scoriae TaxID=643052 RepID=A0A841BHW9_9ACTN|nr:acyltransferase domain-containing protein [Allocatelliglobosispora scoriae]MBB5866928.1 [acyl-carrier-protein] S-malonyltransferase [Allocatelliglobosispora scoriae]
MRSSETPGRPSPVGSVPGTSAPAGTVHLFPGQGDFAVSSLAAGLRRSDALRRTAVAVFDQVDQVATERELPELGPWLLSADPPSGRDLAAAPAGTPQLAMYGVAVLLHQALCNVRGVPRAVLGVSFGEIAAMTAAGILSISDGARIAHDLARILTACPGALTQLSCDEKTAEKLIAAADAWDVAVACVNDDRESIVSGSLAGLAAVELQAEKDGVDTARLRLPFAAHHPSFTPQAAEFARAVRSYPLGAARFPIYSAVAGRAYTSDDDLAAGLADCLIRPVRLPGVLHQIADLRPTALFEAGTGSALSRSARRVLSDQPVAILAPLVQSDFPW